MKLNSRSLLCFASLVFATIPVHGQGGMWEATGMSGSELYVRTLFVALNGNVFAGTDSGLFRSTNQGDSWIEVGPVGVNDVVQPTSTTILAAGREGVHRSADGGVTWTEVLPKPARDECGDMLQFTFVVSTPSGSLLTGGIEEEVASGGCKIVGNMFRSADGVTWSRLAAPFFDSQDVLALSPDTLIHGEDGGMVFYFNIGTGDPISRELIILFKSAVTSLVSDARGRLYAGTGIYIADNGGFTRGTGIYRSTDNGETWQQINEGLTDTTVTDLAVYENGTLLASTLYGGMHRSTDGGDTWHTINTGLPSLWVTALAITADGHVYAGTDVGIVRSTNAIATNSDDDLALPDRFVLEQNYPNPFNPSTTIRYTLPEASRVRLTVYDLMGREVSRLVNGVQASGSHAVTFGGRGLTSGVYVYQLHAGAHAEARRMVLVK